MPADERKKLSTSTTHPSAPVAGAHHGPTDPPAVSDTAMAVVERLKQKGVLSYRLLGFAVIALVAIFVWRYIAGERGKSASRDWINLDQAWNVQDLEAIAEKDPNSYAGKAAEVFLARYRLDQGIRELAAPDAEVRKKAVESVEKARSSFEALGKSFKNDAVQSAECFWAAGKAEEALIGVPKGENSLESRGDPAQAAAFFEQAAAAAGETPLGVQAKAKAAFLKANANEIKTLQSDVYKPASTALDPFHGGPIGPGIATPSIPGFPGPDLFGPKPPLPPLKTEPSAPGAGPIAPAPKGDTLPVIPKAEPAPPTPPKAGAIPPRTPDPSIAPILPPSPPPAKP